MVAMVDAALKKDFAKAEKINSELADFFKGEFIETNPIPIKTAVAWKGMCEEVFRLPLCEMGKENKEKWRDILKSMKII